MAGYKSLASFLLVILLGLWVTEGLLLQKQRRALLPDDDSRSNYEAADYFRKEVVEHLLDESSMPREPSSSDDMQHSTTTAKPTYMEEMEDSEPSLCPGNGTGSRLCVLKSNYVEGYLKRASVPDPDLHDIVAAAMATLSPSTGFELNQKRESGSSVPTSTVRLFKTGANTSRSCDSDDSKEPIVYAGCGDHYLFPGYNVMLMQDETDCSWRFRHTAPEMLVTMRGVQRHHGMQMYIENANVPTSLEYSKRNGENVISRSRLYSFRDLMFSLPADAQAEGISVEVCVPASPDKEKYAEYESHEWQCCNRDPDTKCGIPNNFGAGRFTIDMVPWEVVLTASVKHPTKANKFLVSYCSGSLISDSWVLTTASCILLPEKQHKGKAPFVTVTFGNATDDKLPKHEVEEFIVYPAATDDHDIALVRLKEKVSNTPVCLPGYSKPDLNADVVGKTGTVIGWVLNGGEDYEPYISTLQQHVIDGDECSRRQGKKLPPHMLCTVDSTHGKPCLADGDLLMGSSQFTLRGLSNPRLACKNDYRPHTSVAHFMPWISSVTGIVMPF